MATYKRQFQVRLHDTDAAGILFFANQFLFAHDTYEEFMQHIGVSIESVLRSEDFIIPIVHAESQYLLPLHDGDQLAIVLKIARIGRTSFVLEYELFNSEGHLAGASKTVHVTAKKLTQEKIELPKKLRLALEAFQSAP